MAENSGVATERSDDNALTSSFTDDINRSTSSSNTLEREDPITRVGRFKLRGKTDDLPQWVLLYLHCFEGERRLTTHL